MKMVKGEGICNLMSSINVVNLSIPPPRIDCTFNYINDWYQQFVLFHEMGQFPVAMSSKEKSDLEMKVNSYVLISGILFKRNFNGVLLRCLPPGTVE